MLVRGSDGSYESIDYRETAPAAAFRDMYEHDRNASITGALSVAVPGELRGLEYLHTKYGRLPWETVVTPAVKVARTGFEVNEDLVRYMGAAMQNTRFLVEDPVWAQDFAPNGTLVKLGDIITRKRYADSLEKIARYGAAIFYEGELAQSMVELIQSLNGTMTLDDLKDYTVKTGKPLSADYRGYRLFTTAAPSSGAVTLSMLKTLEQYPFREDPWKDGNLTLHRFVEAMKFAYGARQELGDPEFLRNINEYEKRMLSDKTAREVRGKIMDNQTQPVEVYDPEGVYAADSWGTSHIVTADSSGMTVSSTTTINLLFGAQIMTPDTGIILNDEMDDFSQPGHRNAFGFEPAPANFISPRKRPLSSITPLMAEYIDKNTDNEAFVFATGAAGGSRIVSATAQTAWHVLEHGFSLAEALAAPRLHHQLMPDVLLVEHMENFNGHLDGFDNETYENLAARKHNVQWQNPGLSAVQAIMRLPNGTFVAASEPRQVNSGGFSI
ncbi:gamma-glutamyltranspeptidase 1 [Diplogelasinospora grovesii]|uniref:Gamma-glutamyltranspeptidase 1 n=1 Tax=Diplogelasinospora grovesii TaxID=303347 RepID=A0AAN6NK81_9PEZI|nr:gamma-glutamyltranspeptidase 1 [Diplogelasinospora grovesii]